MVLVLKAYKIQNGFLLRLDKGEEIIFSLASFCGQQKIGFASVSGIGAAENARLAIFDTKNKKYAERDFEGDLEIVSLLGNVALANGFPKPHLHCTLASDDFLAHGGHLVSATVSVTCEIILRVSKTSINRSSDEVTGLMLISD